jgi:hypothetical protein
VRANVTGNADVRFSDGSSLTLDPSTGARVGDFDAHGGRVLLESGRARVRVNPLPHANWTVDAGPYSVHVIGTEFDIRWSANEEVLDVHLLKGAIVVRGPLARDGLSMEAGAHLFANVRKGEIHLDGQPAGASSAEAPAAPAAPRRQQRRRRRCRRHLRRMKQRRSFLPRRRPRSRAHRRARQPRAQAILRR